MDEERIISSIRHQSKLAKDFTEKPYHRFADLLAVKCTEICTKYVFILMNVFHMLMALLMILIGSSSFYALEAFYDAQWLDAQGFYVSVVIISGVLLVFISTFGIIGALKESTAWVNIYGCALCITFCLHIIASIAAFYLVATGSTKLHAINMIDYLIEGSNDPGSAEKMDYIQRTLHCCGREGPDDWDMSQVDYFYRYNVIVPVSYIQTTTTELPNNKTNVPVSCCAPTVTGGSSCEKYYHEGCAVHLTGLCNEIVLIAACVLLAYGVFEIIGIAWTFMLAKIFRQAATHRSIRKFNSQYDKVFDISTTHVDYHRLHNSSDILDDVYQHQ